MTSDFRPEVEIWLFRACAIHSAIIIGTVGSLWKLLWGRYHVPQNVFLVTVILLNNCCREDCRWMDVAMVARWRRRVAATVVVISLIAVVVLLVHGRPSLLDVCPDSSQLRYEMTQQSTQHSAVDMRRLRPGDSFYNHSQHDDFQRDVLRPTDSLPTVATTTATRTKTESRLTRQQFVMHRCPASYNITDSEDAWFRTSVVQRSPPSKRVTFTDEILIVTPICNSEKHIRRYFENLCSLTYPHRLITVVLGEDSSDDDTVKVNTELL